MIDRSGKGGVRVIQEQGWGYGRSVCLEPRSRLGLGPIGTLWPRLTVIGYNDASNGMGDGNYL